MLPQYRTLLIADQLTFLPQPWMMNARKRAQCFPFLETNFIEDITQVNWRQYLCMTPERIVPRSRRLMHSLIQF